MIKNKLFTIRVFISKVLHYILYKIGNLNLNLCGLDPLPQYMYYETKLFKIKKFDYILKNKKINKEYRGPKKEDWSLFINDIKINGIKNNPIVIKDNKIMYIYDGFHRTKAWEVLYGPDSELNYDVYVRYSYVKDKFLYKKVTTKLTEQRIKEIREKEV